MAKHIVITGVAQGLGRALTEEFIALGHTVWGADVQAAAIAPLRAAYPTPHRFHPVDLTDSAQVQRWAAAVLDTGTAPDLVINNAGYMPPLAPLWTVPAADFERAIAVNVQGAVHVLRAFLPVMVARQQGVVVNISAKWGRQGAAQASPFCASKWAIEGLTQALALELPPGMAAVTVAPGAVHTEALAVVHGAAKAATYPSPSDWAKRAAPFFLALTAEQNGQMLSLPA